MLGQINTHTATLHSILTRFETGILDPQFEKAAHAVDAEDFLSLKTAIELLKKSCEFIGAGRLYYACYYILEASNSGQYSDVLSYYPLLIEEGIELKRYFRRSIAEHNSKSTLLLVLITK